MADERETLTFGSAVRELGKAVADDGYEPDMILSIARGGFSSAGHWTTRWTSRTSS